MIGSQKAIPGRFHNVVHTAAILAVMAALFGLLGWMVFGVLGFLWALVAVALLLTTTPRLTPPMILRMYGARSLSYDESPGLHRIVSELSRRAGIGNAPKLYYVASSVMNAFSVGSRTNSAIALSDGLIRHLSRREITGVLAHEMSHIKNNDLKLHTYADMMTRITSLFSFIGQLLVLFYIPVFLFSEERVPFLFILILITAPALSVLLQLALSRAREFVADATAVQFTRDPRGLASALQKMDAYEKNFWDVIRFPGKDNPHPSILRTHPHTRERIDRLMRLGVFASRKDTDLPEMLFLPEDVPEVLQPPRRHWSGPWF